MKRHCWRLPALLATVTLLATACGSGGGGGGGGVDGTINIGVQDFGESAILAEIYGQVLEANGFDVEQVEVGGFRDILLSAFENGQVNFSPEYAFSMLEFLNDSAADASGDVSETVELLQAQLDDRGLVALEPAPAVDTNAFVVTDEVAAADGLVAISDIPADGGGYRLGAPQDCETNPFCTPGLERVYGIDLTSDFVPLDPGLVADTLAAGEVDVGVLFSTSGRIADEGWVLLKDDMAMLAADNVTPVLSAELIDAYGDELVALVNTVSAAITTADLTELNRLSDIEGGDAETIAADYIAEKGLA